MHVHEDPHSPERLRRVSVAADRHVLDRDRKADLTKQVCEEHRAALQDRDEHWLSPLVVPGHGPAELLHPLADVLTPPKDARDLRHVERA